LFHKRTLPGVGYSAMRRVGLRNNIGRQRMDP
jgi:hypothetical protein